ncbi:substrate-binding periplasmic protein [Brevibacterium luteolum]|uniref:Amino acid ABC transporter substrate-binding protein n=1 Tax=Brevibacterium luteolum TaxID=199591 RepID=A0A849ART5_9MICO|nr:ABC transporter substrate-binding protein [Brevibacterium luteolum]MBM7529731.1 polar amino acid transport system substrate-binding protein [Brevibacterium luteolum]NNG78492.1 amino acid ABC transporter substrate-binding protein [Brevibacterium luteolum]
MTPLRLACIDSDAPPLFGPRQSDGTRHGYEPDVAQLVGRALGRQVEWQCMPWDEMIPAVRRGDSDAVLCGQGISPERQALLSYSVPYAVFNETVLVRAGDPARSAQDLTGYRIAAIADSVNEKLARTFSGTELCRFGASADVFGDMLTALKEGDVDAVVDDDVVTVPLGADPSFDVAFTVQTRNPWGIGVAHEHADLLNDINDALRIAQADGSLQAAWTTWMPDLPYPFDEER